MATTVQQVIDEVRPAVGEVSPKKLTDALLIRWTHQAVLSIFHKFVDVLQEKYLSEQTITTSWASGGTKNITLTNALFKALKVVVGTTQFRELELLEVEGFQSNANFASSYGWHTLTETSVKLVKGSSASVQASVDVTGVKKPTAITLVTDTIDLPDEFHELVILEVKKKGYEIGEKYEREQITQQQITSRIQDIENSFRIVVAQAEKGKSLGVGG